MLLHLSVVLDASKELGSCLQRFVAARVGRTRLPTSRLEMEFWDVQKLKILVMYRVVHAWEAGLWVVCPALSRLRWRYGHRAGSVGYVLGL